MDCANVEGSQTPMNDTNTGYVKAGHVETLGERIDRLETRLAFQDETIETLNKTITEQWLKIDALTRQLANISERLQEAEAHVSGAANEPPPHY
jgi:SlyX protein